jgi:TatD DNase family protein
MMLIDTHCHLYLSKYDYDLKDVVERAIMSGVKKIFLPAIDSETHERVHKLADKQFFALNGTLINKDDFEVLPMMGVHPCSIKENFEEELAIAYNHLNSGRKYYAVGEIGLDYYWDVTFKEQQIRAFEKQIEWSIEKNLPIVIHSRNSTADCISVLRQYEGRAKGIFHCFSGTVDEAREITHMGFYLGIGGVITYKTSDLKDVIAKLGLKNIVLETDAPYLTPLPHRGKRNEPSYIKLVCSAVAQALNKDLDRVAQITTENALSVFQMTG